MSTYVQKIYAVQWFSFSVNNILSKKQNVFIFLELIIKVGKIIIVITSK